MELMELMELLEMENLDKKMAEVEIKYNILVRHIYREWPRRLACKCKNEKFRAKSNSARFKS